MNNSNNNNSSKFKFQSSQKMREIENQLEREISGIVNKQKMFENSSNRYSGYNGMSEDVSSKLKSFLDERLAKRNIGEAGFNENAYEQSLDYQMDTDYNNQHQAQGRSFRNDYNENDYYDEEEYDDDDYDYEEEDYDDEDYSDIKRGKTNPNSYLPFTYEELQPEMPSGQELEEKILDSMMPAIAQWLDLNIDRIVHKVVKESLSNRGQQERYSNRGDTSGYVKESNDYSTRYTKVNPQQRASERVERTRISDSIKSIEKSNNRTSSQKNSSTARDNVSRGAVSRNSSAVKKSNSSVNLTGRANTTKATSKDSRSSKNTRNITKR